MSAIDEQYPAKSFVKAPLAVLDYTIDYTRDGPMPSGETIASATATADAGITIDSDVTVGLKHVIWLSGGADGQIYNVVSKIVTSGGRTDQRTIQIVVRET